MAPARLFVPAAQTHAHRISSFTMSLSLKRYTPAEISKMQSAFGPVNKPTLPDAAKWQLEGTTLKLMDGERPAQLTLPVQSIILYPKDNGTVSVTAEFPADEAGNPTCATGKYLHKLFGTDGESASAVAKHLQAMVGSKGPKIPGGIKNAENVKKALNADLERLTGKPDLMPVPFKKRMSDDGYYYRFSFNVYYKKEAKPPREEGSVPADVAAAADGAPGDVAGNPIMEFFRANPGETCNPFAASTAHGSATCWEILFSTMNQGKNTWYSKVLAQLTIGGISIRWNPARKILTCGMYLNGPGLQVFGGVDMSRDQLAGPTEENLAVYESFGLATKRARDDDEDDAAAADIYDRAIKQVKLEPDSGP